MASLEIKGGGDDVRAHCFCGYKNIKCIFSTAGTFSHFVNLIKSVILSQLIYRRCMPCLPKKVTWTHNSFIVTLSLDL